MFLPSPIDMTDQEKAVWALSSNDGNTWFGIGDIIRTKNSPSATTGDSFLVTVGAHIGSDMILEAGSYVGAFTLTATTI